MSKRYFVDTMPLGSGTIVTEKQGFLARNFDVPEDVAEGLVKLTNDFMETQRWLTEVYRNAAGRNYKVEVPAHIKELVCPDQPSAETPKSTDSAAPSKKKSPTRRKKTS